jgi:hypothetical protein
MTPLFFNDQNTGSYMQVLLHLNPNELTITQQPDGSRQTVIDILAVNFGEGGRVVDQFNDTQTIKLPASGYEKMLQSGLSFVLNVPIKQPGSYQFHIAVRDTSTGNVGAAREYVVVPDLSRNVLTLSGIVLSVTKARVVTNTPANAAGAASAKGESDLQFSPAIRRARAGMTLKYDYVIYNPPTRDENARTQELETQMRVLRDGKQIYTGALMGLDMSKQPDPKRLKAGGYIHLGQDFTAGAYVLQVVVRETGAKEQSMNSAVTQSIDFEIVD